MELSALTSSLPDGLGTTHPPDSHTSNKTKLCDTTVHYNLQLCWLPACILLSSGRKQTFARPRSSACRGKCEGLRRPQAKGHGLRRPQAKGFGLRRPPATGLLSLNAAPKSVADASCTVARSKLRTGCASSPRRSASSGTDRKLARRRSGRANRPSCWPRES